MAVRDDDGGWQHGDVGRAEEGGGGGRTTMKMMAALLVMGVVPDSMFLPLMSFADVDVDVDVVVYVYVYVYVYVDVDVVVNVYAYSIRSAGLNRTPRYCRDMAMP